MKAAGIILAAGASRRLGSPKQLAIVGDERLLERAVRCCVAAGLSPVIVVLGAMAEQIEETSDLREAKVILNADWETGAASSVRAGILALDRLSIDAAVLMTCDMPFVTSAHLSALIQLSERVCANVASKTTEWRGVPACFLKSSFPELLALQGDEGARKLLLNAPFVELANGLDVDTIDDLVRANEFAS